MAVLVSCGGTNPSGGLDSGSGGEGVDTGEPGDGTSSSSATSVHASTIATDAASTTTSEGGSGSSASSGGSDEASTSEADEGTGLPTGPDNTDTSSSEDASSTGEGDTSSGNLLWTRPNLWYSVADKLHYIEIDPADGTVVRLVTSTISTVLIDGQNGITMLDDGSLLGSRESAGTTQIFHVAEPPTEEATIEVDIIGVVPDELRVEGLYTDCQGLVYLMDTGADTSSAEGNRLLRFTGDYLAGDLDYEVITDLEQASVADIDDMGPGINLDGEITDGQGLAIDSGMVYAFDYNTGTGTLVGSGGTWGIHALGGPLFDDGTARLYLLNRDAELVEADPHTLELSDVLVQGPPSGSSAAAGWSSLAGPLTECESTLPVPQ